MTNAWRLVRANPIAAGAIAVGALLLTLVIWQQWRTRKTDEDIGKWKAIATRLQSDSAAAAAGVRRVDSVYTRDTVTLRTVLKRYVTLRDTINVHDTTQVIRTIAAADTAILACREALQTCEQRVAARDSLITVLGRQRIADRNLYAAELRRANPRVVPYLEGLIDPTDTRTIVARGGIEWRTIGRLRLVAAGQYTTTGDHQFRALAGVRLTF